jgi:hypothetical protein
LAFTATRASYPLTFSGSQALSSSKSNTADVLSPWVSFFSVSFFTFKNFMSWVPVAYPSSVIPSSEGDWDREDHRCRPPWAQMLVRLHLNRKGWVWWCVPIIPATVGSIKYEAHGLDQPGQKGIH